MQNLIFKKNLMILLSVTFFVHLKDLSHHKVKLIKITTLTPTHWIEVIENDRFLSCWLFKYYPKNSHQQRFRFITFCAIFSVIDFCNIYNFFAKSIRIQRNKQNNYTTILLVKTYKFCFSTRTHSHTQNESKIGLVMFSLKLPTND